jgi:hypothetical protein
VKTFTIVGYAAALAVSLLLAMPAQALDFTAQESWRVLEGVRIPLLMFTDPTGRIRYQPPGNWTYSGGGATLALYPPGSNGSFMKFILLGHADGIPQITDLPSDNLVKWSQNYLGADAQEVKLLDENPSPFMLSGKPSREFIFAYKSSGQRFQTSVAVLDWTEREHLAIVITAPDQEFKAVRDTGISSLFSWSLRKSETPAATPAPEAAAAPAPAAPAALFPGPTPIRALRQ